MVSKILMCFLVLRHLAQRPQNLRLLTGSKRPQVRGCRNPTISFWRSFGPGPSCHGVYVSAALLKQAALEVPCGTHGRASMCRFIRGQSGYINTRNLHFMLLLESPLPWALKLFRRHTCFITHRSVYRTTIPLSLVTQFWAWDHERQHKQKLGCC